MSISRRKGRFMLWLAAALLFICGVVIGAGVIPITGIYNYPSVKPEAVMSVYWGCLVFSGFGAIIVGSIAASGKSLSLSAGMLVASVMLLALLFSFGLREAAFGVDSRGTALRMVGALLHACSAADFAIALLIVIAVVLLPRRTNGTRGRSAN